MSITSFAHLGAPESEEGWSGVIGNQTRKRHHTVMRALLAGFASDGRVRTRMRQGKEVQQSVGDASVVKHFYSVQQNGDHDDSVERWLAADVEYKFARLLPALREGQPPRQEEREVVSRFVAAAAVRTQTAEAIQRETTPSIGTMILLSEVAHSNDIDLLALSSSDLAHLRAMCQEVFMSDFGYPEKASMLRTLVWFTETTSERLTRYHWSVDVTPQPALLIGDAPVVSVSPKGVDQWDGIIGSRGTVFLPLSPTALLVGQPHVFAPSVATTSALAPFVNHLTARDAHTAVYRHPHMPWPSYVDLPSTRQPIVALRSSISRSTGSPDNKSGQTPDGGYPPLKDPRSQALMDHLLDIRDERRSAARTSSGVTGKPDDPPSCTGSGK